MVIKLGISVALRIYMRQNFRVLHTLFLPPIGAFPGGRAYPKNGTPERLSLSGSHGLRPWVSDALRKNLLQDGPQGTNLLKCNGLVWAGVLIWTPPQNIPALFLPLADGL